MAGGELELAQHGADVGLDGLDGDPEALGDLLVEVAAGDVAQDLALARGELVELGVDAPAAGADCRPPLANASSTKPASRGEKTASPSCTRRIASASSVGEIVLVT